MTTTHPQVSWFAGDDWQINALLLDDTGAPFNLGSAVVKWALSSEAGETVIDDADVNVVVVDAAAGLCAIHVPSSMTSPLLQGRYRDSIRIVAAGITSSLCWGYIWVTADPWGATASADAGNIRLVAS